MNTGAFGENFPYSNFHDLNTDWIIKIAKDFLDQYTHIQQVITDGETSLTNLTTEGLQQLQEKADALEALLQAWYDTHSEDIANKLADALEDLNQTLQTNTVTFNQRAEAKGEQVIASIPSDYTTLSNLVELLKNGLVTSNAYNILASGETSNETSQGLTYTFNADRSCTIVGTTTGSAWKNLWNLARAQLESIEAGKLYHIAFNGDKVKIRIYSHHNDDLTIIYDSNKSGMFIVPSNMTDITVRLQINGNTTVNETVDYPIITTALTNTALSELGVLENNSDANNIADGWYLIIDDNTYSNIPFSVGFLFQRTFDNTALQIGVNFNSKNVNIRRKIDTEWNTWVRYDSTNYHGNASTGFNANNALDGWYLFTDDRTYTNIPYSVGFLYTQTADNTKLQIAINYNCREFSLRRAYDNSWGDWQSYASGLASRVSALEGYKIAQNNTDMNTLTNGWYFLTDDKTFLNSPITVGYIYSKTVENTTLQFAIDYNTRNLYFRRAYENSWGDWYHTTGINTKTKLAMFGDSVTWGRNGAGTGRVTEPISNFIWKYSRHIAVDNYGVGGQGWLEPIDGKTAYDTLRNTDLSGYTAVSMCYGLNDPNAPMGVYTDTGTTTIMGVIYNCFNYLKTNYPNIVPILIGIPNSCIHTEIGFPKWDWYRVRAGGWSDETFDQECRKFCDYYHVPYISLKQSPINSFNITSYLPDGVHPNQSGYELLGSFLRSQLENILGS